jgi:hypothetical protein
LPQSLPAAIERYGHRFFKLKIGGDPAHDLERLRAIVAVLHERAPGFRYTLDGNEQYAAPGALEALLAGLRELPRPHYIEQPTPRDASFAPLPCGDGSDPPFLLDEADGTLDAFARARAFGWTGVSSKGCKGLYKALVNRARCDRWNGEAGRQRFFMSAEDLTCQAGLAVQQDLALAALLGLSHSERNGHHYADGLASSPTSEQGAFAAAHTDLYETSAGHPRLRIDGGAIAIGSLAGAAGFAHAADPDIEMRPLAELRARRFTSA